jgi:hypothetical protein
MLRSVLPMVARASAESAKAATLAATAINSNENELGQVREALDRTTEALTALKTSVDSSLVVLATEKQENGKWIRRLVSPELFAQVVLNILLIAGAMFGVRAMMVPTTTAPVVPDQAGQHEQP